MRHANDVANATPRKGDELTPLELFSGIQIAPKLRHSLPFGCPTYVLDNALQSGQGAPKWKERARLGVYLGPSPNHARSVALVLNPRTGHVSPQFHVKFDDFFETVQAKSTDLDTPDPAWKYLSGFATRKGATKTDAKGGLDGLLAPRRGAPAATNQPQAANLHGQPAGPIQDLPMPLDNVDEANEHPSIVEPAAPAASPGPQEVPPPASTRQTRSGRVIKDTPRYGQSKRLIRAVKQSRIRQVRASARYQHGFQVPKDYNDAMRLDKENGNTHWQDAMDLELTQIHEYKVFKDTGKAQFHNGKVVIPDGFQKIRVHFVYAVKHDGRFKARLVADGHLTKEPVESIYSGVVSLRSLRMVVFLSQLNNLEIWGADAGNAYLEAYTDEKLCIMAGPEFKELQGHLLIMVKALYGTRSGGARWHDRLFDILQELKFKPSKADPDVWMRPEPGGTCYEYIAVYVDDLAIAAKDPQAFCNELKKKYNLKLKGVGPLEYQCTYKKDPDGTLAADPRRYVNKILESYERMFKVKPRKSRPPLEGGDHPELDTSELCDEHQTKQFQTLIGQLQWLISLGCFDIAVHVMSLSRFRAQPRKGHLDRAKRNVGYLLFLHDGAIRFRIGEPDFSSLKDQEYDWTRTVYSGACEQIPHDIPKPLGKHVQTTHYVDANLHHDLATGKAVTAALHFLNQTPIDAYTKRQSTVETATYGSEFVAARTAVDQIIDIRTTLRYLGVPIRDKSYMFGDNKSVVTSSTIPNSTISKRHHLASYHRVREAIAAKFISFHWKDGKSNPADILSKHWEFATVWPMLKPILFWRGETATQLKGSDRIPSTTPGAEPPRDAKDSGSARSHSTHLETSSSNRP